MQRVFYSIKANIKDRQKQWAMGTNSILSEEVLSELSKANSSTSSHRTSSFLFTALTIRSPTVHVES